MDFLTFQNGLKKFPVISIHDIRKQFPNFDGRRLVEWQQKGYIRKIRRGYYCFSDQQVNEMFMYHCAGKIYKPSYVSVETALSYYNLIPEGVFTITSATTNNTTEYHTALGRYQYKHLKRELFFGYKLLDYNGVAVKIAEPEKALLDYLYLNLLNHEDDFAALRLNEFESVELLNSEKIKKYLAVFDSKVLHRRIKILKKVIHA